MAHIYQFFEESEHTEAFIVSSYKKHNEESGKLNWAAIIIQNFFRGIYVRQQIKKMHQSAIIIQKYVRGWLQRYRLPDIMAEYYDNLCLQHYNKAAEKIQSRWKGYMVRMYEVCIKDIIKMREETLKANENIKLLFQRRFSEMDLDDFGINRKYAYKVFKILSDRHHLLSTHQIKGVLHKQDAKNELSELEKLLKAMPWKNYMKEVHKIYYEYYDEHPPYKYKYNDKRLRKQEDLLKYNEEIRCRHEHDKNNETDPTSSDALREKLFNLTTKLEIKPYERYISTTGKFVKPIKNIVRTTDPSKNISETDFDLKTLTKLALKSKIPPYYINFWLDKCPCNQTDL
ncbi:unconventional myosin-Vc [Diorhabda carinulata]|uniref:unconventional myosin-Vc n=1 Tax=Diorhabda carinulata TaxID=1163345 RepID=UPI0025A30A2A|nr:unconventional myosin-Vc [Diorhabda carinulata]